MKNLYVVSSWKECQKVYTHGVDNGDKASQPNYLNLQLDSERDSSSGTRICSIQSFVTSKRHLSMTRRLIKRAITLRSKKTTDDKISRHNQSPSLSRVPSKKHS